MRIPRLPWCCGTSSPRWSLSTPLPGPDAAAKAAGLKDRKHRRLQARYVPHDPQCFRFKALILGSDSDAVGITNEKNLPAGILRDGPGVHGDTPERLEAHPCAPEHGRVRCGSSSSSPYSTPATHRKQLVVVDAGVAELRIALVQPFGALGNSHEKAREQARTVHRRNAFRRQALYFIAICRDRHESLRRCLSRFAPKD